MFNAHLIPARRWGRCRKSIAVAGCSVIVLISSDLLGPMQAVAQTTTTAPRSAPIKVRVQLNGSGFEDPTGFAPEFHGTFGPFGTVEGGIKGKPDSESTVLGISNGKIRVRAPGRFTFRTAYGTIEGTTVASLALAVTLTPAGPVPNSNEFIELSEQFTVTGGTGRFRNSTGTISLSGILPELPSVNGKRRFSMELSGEATLQLDPTAV